MNVATLTSHRYQSLMLWVIYCLYLLTLPSIIGAFISWLEVRKTEKQLAEHNTPMDEASQIIDSHHHWLIRTFVICLVLSMCAIGTTYYGVGYVVGLATILWWYFRVIKGMVRLYENRPMPD